MTDDAPRVLVTGASGFLGRALCEVLRKDAIPLRAMVRARAQGAVKDTAQDQDQDTEMQRADTGLDYEEVGGDLLRPDSLLACCTGIHSICHTAGLAHVSGADDTGISETNFLGTVNLLTAAIECKVKRLVFISSSLASYDERTDVEQTAYGVAKRQAELALLEAHKSGEIEVVILRPVNVYGPSMRGNIKAMMSLIAKKRLPPLPQLNNAISLVGIDDLVSAAILALSNSQASGNLYTVSDGREYRISDIEQRIYECLGRRKPRWRSPLVLIYLASLFAELGNVSRLYPSSIGLRTYRNLVTDNLFDNSAICDDLGFSPKANLFDEMPQLIESLTQV